MQDMSKPAPALRNRSDWSAYRFKRKLFSVSRFPHRPLTSARRLVLVVACLALAMIPLVHADPIYKCGNGAQGVVYTDTPCKGGERLDVNAGAADPAALDRLKEVRKALDQSADRRLAAQQRAIPALSTSGLPPYSPLYAPEATAERDDDYPYADVGYAPGWYVPVIRPRAHRPRATVDSAPRFAPRPPYAVPR